MTGPDAGHVEDRALPRPAVVRLLVVLAAASGCIDVFCVTRLGGFFASVITGNLVQLGHAVATAKSHLMAGGVTAVGGYALGVAAGTLPLRRVRPGWHRRTGVVAAGQSLLLVAVAVGWWRSGGRTGYAEGLALLGTASAASGVQSAITLSVGLRGAATTYLTGSLTELVRGVVLDPHRVTTGAGGVSRLLGVFAGAALGGLTLQMAPSWTPALAAALVVAVVVAAGLALARARPAG
ncbi:YoaK family protein [Micromonospora sp. WMMD812]|uniref:YoaK family protein n=1 Tax=Micromonospora sp. WMMD812 TaxID=3015152 RepID=UPI00248CC325|nr:YoaK family protein [Micromonospora sp. WMMD812]WBB70014.1 YoaK family protein [Micromonospora sp. WMMD812]